MDDDAEPTSKCLEKLLKETYRNKFMAVCPLIIGISKSGEEKIQFYHHKLLKKSQFLKEGWRILSDKLLNNGIVRLDANAFVGPLIHRNVVSGVGFPDKDYFIALLLDDLIWVLLFVGKIVEDTDEY